MTRSDRRDLGLLGLWVLAFGLVVAPLLHRLDHGHRHQHGPVRSEEGRHGDGALEHQSFSFDEAPVQPEPLLFAVQLALPSDVEARAPALRHRWTVEQPQGP